LVQRKQANLKEGDEREGNSVLIFFFFFFASPCKLLSLEQSLFFFPIA